MRHFLLTRGTLNVLTKVLNKTKGSALRQMVASMHVGLDDTKHINISSFGCVPTLLSNCHRPGCHGHGTNGTLLLFPLPLPDQEVHLDLISDLNPLVWRGVIRLKQTAAAKERG